MSFRLNIFAVKRFFLVIDGKVWVGRVPHEIDIVKRGIRNMFNQ